MEGKHAVGFISKIIKKIILSPLHRHTHTPVWKFPNNDLPHCSAIRDVDLKILPLYLRVDDPTTENASDDSLYILSIIGEADVPTIFCR